MLLVFVGNPRSGTTLVRSLLNAHPAICIANEWNLVERLAAGNRSWRGQVAALFASATHFDATPRWQGYDYQIAPPAPDQAAAIRVIGDKKAGRTTLLLTERPELLDQLTTWSPVPVRFVHCVRDPLDVIATKTRRNGLPLDRNVVRYFELERTVAALIDRLGPDQVRSVYLERLIAAPRETMADLCDFLGVSPIVSYLDACAERVFTAPRRTRDDVDWPEMLERQTLAHTASIAHLAQYADNKRDAMLLGAADKSA